MKVMHSLCSLFSKIPPNYDSKRSLYKIHYLFEMKICGWEVCPFGKMLTLEYGGFKSLSCSDKIPFDAFDALFRNVVATLVNGTVFGYLVPFFESEANDNVPNKSSICKLLLESLRRLVDFNLLL